MQCHAFVVLLILGLAATDILGEEPLVDLPQGQLRGTITSTRHGRPFHSFQGIPYVAPPVGDLRFKPPQPPLKWSGIRDGTQTGPNCPQMMMVPKRPISYSPIGEEDCLFLNVYVPQTNEPHALLPVMVWVHGGAFELGSGDPRLYGAGNLLDKDVILVTFNYRLGILGFLSTEDDVAPGNWGLKDQVAALRWVKENIAHFGGDPNSVTIFGESAGGASVHFLVLSPLAKGLFHRAISQSGTALAHWTVQHNARQTAMKLGTILECPESAKESSQELLRCLRTKTTEDLVKAKEALKEWGRNPAMPFRPVIEPESVGNKRFLTDEPRSLLEKGDFNHVPFITGVTTEEGCVRSAEFVLEPQLLEELNKDYVNRAPLLFGFDSIEDSKELVTKIRLFYFGNAPLWMKNINKMTDLFTDRMFALPALQTVNIQSETSEAPVYFYLFNFRGKYSMSTAFTGTIQNLGVCHADDLLYLFSNLIFSYSEETDPHEYKMTDIFVELWTNFAIHGNPTPGESNLISVKWPSFTQEKTTLLRLNPEPTLQTEFFNERMQFWETISLPRRINKSKDEKDEL